MTAHNMRIKPNISILFFNKDGVIINSKKISWGWDSLDPGKTYKSKNSFLFRIPEELTFSRWAPVAYDITPKWIFVAGSSKMVDELEKKSEARIKALNDISIDFKK